MRENFDVIVVGAGHAGCEAAVASANMGSKVLLITLDLAKIAQMSCNPAVGGIAKGQIVREIDALGGFMGVITDKSTIHFRLLNRSKGAAMWSPRSQNDRFLFASLWKEKVMTTDNLSLWQDNVTELLISKGRVVGVKTELGMKFSANAVVLTNGTFLNGVMHTGTVKQQGGRVAEPASVGLVEQLMYLGHKADRMKTGTPMRLDARTIYFDECEEQKGEQEWHQFSFSPDVSNKELPQRSCYITHTNPEVHKLLLDNLDDSPLYNGQIQSIGPRYCPSIETKVTTFRDKEHHQLFLEPEGLNTTEIYVNGFSSSMPLRVQLEAIRKIKPLRDAQILRPGYAIEYAFFDPMDLSHSLQSRFVKGLFLAGQINGTTGYEEAAGQGLVAGVNAHYAAQGLSDELVLGRDEGYIGVLIDDLVTKGVDEPYRMFTSRAEYRILLRQDNADDRLTEKGFALGLVTEKNYKHYTQKKKAKEELKQLLHNTSIRPSVEVNELLSSLETTPIKQGCKAVDLLLRPTITLDSIVALIPSFNEALFSSEVCESVEIEEKYSGYILREKASAEKAKRLEEIRIKGHFDYDTITSLSTEARQKLKRISPETIGQASRIPGISPSDINILLVLLGR